MINSLVEVNPNGQLTTTSLIIAEGVGNEHASVIRLIRENIEDFQEFNPLRFEIAMGEALPQGGFAKATEYAILNEPQATLLLTYMRNNDVVKQFKKALVKAFYELRQTPNPAVQPPSPELEFFNFAMNRLQMSRTSEIRAMKLFAEEMNLPSKFLPDYSTDESLTRSLTNLLKQHGCDISAREANKRLIEAGYLEELERPSTGKTVKRFKSLTAKGLEFGRNETSVQGPNQTQPRFYVERFKPLLNAVFLN